MGKSFTGLLWAAKTAAGPRFHGNSGRFSKLLCPSLSPAPPSLRKPAKLATATAGSPWLLGRCWGLARACGSPESHFCSDHRLWDLSKPWGPNRRVKASTLRRLVLFESVGEHFSFFILSLLTPTLLPRISLLTPTLLPRIPARHFPQSYLNKAFSSLVPPPQTLFHTRLL